MLKLGKQKEELALALRLYHAGKHLADCQGSFFTTWKRLIIPNNWAMPPKVNNHTSTLGIGMGKSESFSCPSSKDFWRMYLRGIFLILFFIWSIVLAGLCRRDTQVHSRGLYLCFQTCISKPAIQNTTTLNSARLVGSEVNREVKDYSVTLKQRGRHGQDLLIKD